MLNNTNDISLAGSHKIATGTDDPAIRRMKLKKASGEFEALFVNQLLKTMRASFATKKKDDQGLGKDVFMSIADQALADKIGQHGAFGIGKALMKSFDQRENTSRLNAEETETNKKAYLPLQHSGFTSIKTDSPHFVRLSEKSKRYDVSRVTTGQLDDLIKSASRKHQLPNELIRAVVQVESGGNRFAVSRRGAKGLMQLTDSTAREMGVRDVFNPKDNIDGGTKYLSSLIRRFSGDLRLALAAYNAGPAVVARFGGVPPYRETVRYIDKVLSFMQKDNSKVISHEIRQ